MGAFTLAPRATEDRVVEPIPSHSDSPPNAERVGSGMVMARVAATFFKRVGSTSLPPLEEPDVAADTAEASPEDDTCIVCLTGPMDAVLLECGHGGVCEDCAMQLWQNTRPCPLCRGRISRVMRIVEDGDNRVRVVPVTRPAATARTNV